MPEYEANVDAPGCAPGFRARARGEGDGVCEGKREREKWIQDYAAERGALPGDILELRGRCGMSVWSGYVRLRDRFASYWHNRDE